MGNPQDSCWVQSWARLGARMKFSDPLSRLQLHNTGHALPLQSTLRGRCLWWPRGFLEFCAWERVYSWRGREPHPLSSCSKKGNCCLLVRKGLEPQGLSFLGRHFLPKWASPGLFWGLCSGQAEAGPAALKGGGDARQSGVEMWSGNPNKGLWMEGWPLGIDT